MYAQKPNYLEMNRFYSWLVFDTYKNYLAMIKESFQEIL